MNPIAFPLFAGHVLSLYPANTAAHAKFRQVLRSFGGLPGVETTADLTEPNFNRWVQGLTCNPNSKRGYLSYLRAAANIAVEQGWLDRAPSLRRILPRAVRMTRNPVLSSVLLARLLDHLRSRSTSWRARRLFALTYVVALTGLRRDEALCLRVCDLDWGRRLLHVVERERPLKTAASARSVAVPAELVPVLIDWVPWCGGTWIFPGTRRTGPWLNATAQLRALGELQAAAQEAGIGRVTWHGLRHSFATIALLEWRVPLWAVSKSLGHTSLRTTERYLHLDDPARLVSELQDCGFLARPRALPCPD